MELQGFIILSLHLLPLIISAGKCPPGSINQKDGRKPCTKCPIRTYQPKSGQRKCIRCPLGTTTVWIGSVLQRQCVSRCFLWGDPHYVSGDGKRFDFQGACRYILMTDSTGNRFTIEIEQYRRRPSSRVAFSKSFTLRFAGRVVELEQFHVFKVDGSLIDGATFRDNHMVVYKRNWRICVYLKAAHVRFCWARNHIAVAVPGRTYKGKLRGLCGDFNGDASNDFRKPDNSPASTAHDFGNSWKIGEPEGCKDDDGVSACSGIGAAVMSQITRTCNILTSPPYSACLPTSSTFVENCKTELCDCNGTTSCICSTIEMFLARCSPQKVAAIGNGWKSMYNCYSSCLYDKTEYQHGTTWTVACNICACNDGTAICTSSVCVDECVCNLWGDPHYTSCDGKRFDFQGTCRYTLMKDAVNDTFSIEIVQHKRRPGSKVAFSKSFTLWRNANMIILEHNHVLLVNGERINPPNYEDSELKVYTRGPTIFVKMLKIPVTFMWRSNHHARVIVGPQYSGKICGLCGNYDGNRTNDFLTSEQKLVSHPQEFGNSWKLPDNSPPGCEDDLGENACSSVSAPIRKQIKSACAILKQSPFDLCQLTSIDALIADCEIEMCDCNGQQSCICSTIESVVQNCAQKGIKIGDEWRKTHNCYQSCFYKGREYNHGTSWREECNTCSCRNGNVQCTNTDCTDACLCTLWGDPHYKSCDGRRFDFQGDCRYILAKECNNDNFSIEIVQYKRNPKSRVAFSKSFTIKIGVRVIELDQNQAVMVDGTDKSSPFEDNDVLIYVRRSTIYVQLKLLGVMISWANNHYARVLISSQYKGKLCGLCGDYNGVPSNDFTKPDGNLAATPHAFGNSWKTDLNNPPNCINDEGGDVCDDVSPLIMPAITAACKALTLAPFDKCTKVSSTLIADCRTELCDCNGQRSCICTTLETFADECKASGVDIGDGWRATHNCYPSCIYKRKEYKYGRSWRDDCNTCSCRDGEVSCTDNNCINNCVCTLWGDPHYRTCDRRRYDFQGDCRYIFVKDCANDTFTIEVVQHKRRPRSRVSYSKSFTIKFGSRVIELEHNHVAKVDGQVIAPALYDDDEISIFTWRSRIYVLLKKLKILLCWANNHHGKVYIGPEYKGKLCGLCGNYDGNSGNDFTTPDGHLVTKAHIFGNSWQTALNNPKNCLPGTDVDPCTDVSPVIMPRITAVCNSLTQPPFSSCTGVSSAELVANCKTELCDCNGQRSCICTTLETFADECKASGVDIGDGWRATHNCYRSCIYKRKEYKHGRSWRDDCNTCSCRDGEVSCTDNNCINNCVCTLWGDPHYRTCDRKRYDFQGDCRYIFVKDCANDTFTIEVVQHKRRPRSRVSYSKSFTIKFGSRVIELEHNHVAKVDGQVIAPALYDDDEISIFTWRSRIYVLLKKLKILLCWANNHHGKVYIGPEYKGKLCGLCGNYDGNSGNDFTTPDGHLVTKAHIFGNSWQTALNNPKNCLPGTDVDPCTDVSPVIMPRITAVCNSLTQPPFSSCTGVSSAELVANCKTELCDCNGQRSCICTTLETFADECKASGVDIGDGWRATHNCYRSCIYKRKEYKHGRSWRDDCNTCSCRDGEVSCTDNNCINNCVCTLWGDPHYRTCDRKRYDFQGDCRYIFVKDCANDTFTIEVVQHKRRPRSRVSYSKSFTIKFGSRVIELEHNHVAKVDGQVIAPALYDDDEISIFTWRSRIYVLLKKLKILLCWANNHHGKVYIGPEYKGKLCGLCGNYDGNSGNDFTTPDGHLVTKAHIFGNSWQTALNNPKNCLPGTDVDPCTDVSPVIMPRITAVCNSLTQPPFSSCTGVSSAELVANCKTELCDCNGQRSCICTTLETFADECKASGVDIGDGWRATHNCYRSCIYKRKEYKHGRSWRDDCNTCSCRDGEVSCTDNNCINNCVCTLWGDPHYRTCDRKRYDFQGDCRYIFVKDCANDTFTIEVVQHKRRPRSRVSYSKSFTIKFGSRVIELEHNHVAKVDGQVIAPALYDDDEISIFTWRSRIYVLLKKLKILLCWANNHHGKVYIGPEYKGKLCGLCGNYDGNSGNDFTTPDGHLVTKAHIFGNSWQTALNNPKNCLPGTDVDPCTDVSPVIMPRITAVCNSLTQPPFSSCTGVSSAELVANCKTELCDCNGQRSCICTTLETFADECKASGVDIGDGWRATHNCYRSCIYKRKEYKHGRSWRDDCNTCSCRDGEVSCTDNNCINNCVCTLWGDPHYRTCDRKRYDFQGDCRYIFVKDCANDTFTIEVVQHKRRPRSRVSYSKSFTIKFGSRVIELEHNHVAKVDGQVIAPALYDDDEISIFTWRSRIYVLLKKLKILLCWANNHHGKVYIGPEYKGKLCGLCGNYDGNSGNDFTTPDGHLVTKAHIFGNSWKTALNNPKNCLPGTDVDPCTDVSPVIMPRITAVCNSLTQPPFSSCTGVSSAELVANCKTELCDCNGQRSCICTTLETFADECKASGVNIGDGWRATHNCYRSCIYKRKEYKHGRSWRDDCNTCSCRDGEVNCGDNDCGDSCVCSLWGDPHYTSCDGRRFDFQGSCRYILAKDCASNTFTIEIEQYKRRPRSRVAFSKSFLFTFGERRIEIDQNHVLTVDGRFLMPAIYNDNEVSIYTRRATIYVHLKKLLILFSWANNHRARLYIGSHYRGNLCGLCGDFNGVRSNDFTKPNGRLASSAHAFGNSWKTASGQPRSCVDADGRDACKGILPVVVRRIKRTCNALRRAPYDKCKSPALTALMENCQTELCDCHGGASCICTTMKEVADECLTKGVDVGQEWKAQHGCYRSCIYDCKEYRHLSTWPVDCNTCSCNDGEVSCSDNECYMCGKKKYDPARKNCCRGRVVTKGECCGTRSYNPSRQSCCAGRVHRKGLCCGHRTYKPKLTTCCANTIVPIGSCCRNRPFNRIVKECCSGTIVPKGRCCGNVIYNPRSKVCCSGVLVTKGRCCRGKQYNPSQKTCCRGRIRSKGRCCGGRSYRPLVSVCCGNRVVPKGRCCGKQVYNPSVKTCCRQRVVLKGRCCGSLSYNPAVKVCCGQRVVLKGRCCGILSYNPAVKVCCGQRVVLKGRCCGRKQYDPRRSKCCGGRVYRGASWECCGGKIVPSGTCC